MKILEWLHGPLGEMLRSTIIGGLAVSVLGGVLSVLVVLKRLSFIGQGVSHSAFGGIGVAAVVAAATSAAVGEAWSFPIILVFCVASAVGMAMVSDPAKVEADTAIGVFLVASMALGAALVSVATRMATGATGAARWEAVLFGSFLGTSSRDAWIAVGIGVVSVAIMWWYRRPLVFWAFDEPAARAFGVSTKRMKLTLIILLAVATVTAMKLAGVVYATALLVLPGAAALRLSSRMWPVVGISCVVAVLGLLVGLIVSLQFNLPSGAVIVLTLTALFAAACGWAAIRSRGRASA